MLLDEMIEYKERFKSVETAKDESEEVTDEDVLEKYLDAESGMIRVKRIFGHTPEHTSVVRRGANRRVAPRLKSDEREDDMSLWDRLMGRYEKEKQDLSLEDEMRAEELMRKLSDLKWAFTRHFNRILEDEKITDKAKAIDGYVKEYTTLFKKYVDELGKLKIQNNMPKAKMKSMERIEGEYSDMLAEFGEGSEDVEKIKAGKVISKKNISELTKAIKALQAVMASAKLETEDDTQNEEEKMKLDEITKELAGLKEVLKGQHAYLQGMSEIMFGSIATQTGKDVKDIRENFKELQLPKNAILQTTDMSGATVPDIAKQWENLVTNPQDPQNMAMKQSMKSTMDAMGEVLTPIFNKISENFTAINGQISTLSESMKGMTEKTKSQEESEPEDPTAKRLKAVEEKLKSLGMTRSSSNAVDDDFDDDEIILIEEDQYLEAGERVKSDRRNGMPQRDPSSPFMLTLNG